MKFLPSQLIQQLVCCVPCVLVSSIGFAQSPRVPTPPPAFPQPAFPQPASPTRASPPAATPPAAAASPPAVRGGQRPVDRIVAVVNDEVVTANELRSRAQVAEMQLRRQKIQPPPLDVLERQVLERMIVDRAQMQLARETGVRVDDATVNATLGRVAESNGLTVQTLRQRLEADGVSFAQFRDDIRQDIILNRLREREVDSRIQISKASWRTSLLRRPAWPRTLRKSILRRSCCVFRKMPRTIASSQLAIALTNWSRS